MSARGRCRDFLEQTELPKRGFRLPKSSENLSSYFRYLVLKKGSADLYGS